MKKILFFAVIATAVISCTKKNDNPTGNYTCHCIIDIGVTTDTSNIPENNMTKSVAQNNCNQEQTAFTNGNTGATVTCTLK